MDIDGLGSIPEGKRDAEPGAVRRHNRLAGLLGHYYLIGPWEALRIIAIRDKAKIREAWMHYDHYKTLVIGNTSFAFAARIMRNSACRKAKML